ncbi:hypothetical protein RM697_01540 [Ichthyenterobacterium sp. W332]|uniref:Anti sigma-E protein RseA N-terminal domain-containing protein n=1 Tax=Microcosmobacter mediterraneus TaxID=3075607 RepID=A0ABU2YHQ4_9FLAO|nr:hypothetical protein [Ichthyenterobacterium sp. W332]MDT0557310.1 hypothetical protein [Ichthyenterobacterium sp. W332]
MINKDLHNIKTTGFKTPDNYFESLDDKVLKSLNSKPKLKDSMRSGFKVPDDYFNTLEDHVISKVSSDQSKVVNLFNRKNLLYISGIAAALVLMFSIFTSKEETFEIDSEMVELYLEEQDLGTYELASLLNEVQLLDEDFSIIEEQINESDLESYLLDNVNIQDIIEQ